MLKFASLPRERNDLNLHLHLEMRKVSSLRQLPEMGENKLDFLLNKGRRCNDFTCKSLYSLKNTEFRRELFVIHIS